MIVNAVHEGVVEVIGVDNEATSRDDGLAWCHTSRGLAGTQKAEDDQRRRGARRCSRSRCSVSMIKQVRSDINNVHEVVQEMVVDLEVRVLYVDEDIIVLEIVEVAIEIVEVLVMQICKDPDIVNNSESKKEECCKSSK